MLSFNAESVARITQSGYEAALAQEENFMALKEKLEGEGEDTSQTKDSTKDSSKKRAINILQNRVNDSKETA